MHTHTSAHTYTRTKTHTAEALFLHTHEITLWNAHPYTCDCAWENQSYWLLLRKWGFNRTDKYRSIETAWNKLKIKQNCIISSRFIYYCHLTDLIYARNGTKSSTLYLIKGIVQHCKLRFKPGFLMYCHLLLSNFASYYCYASSYACVSTQGNFLGVAGTDQVMVRTVMIKAMNNTFVSHVSIFNILF